MTTTATIILLNSLAPVSPNASAALSANGVDSQGVAVGWLNDASGQQSAVEWVNGTVSPFSLLSGGTSSSAFGINNSGEVVGWISSGAMESQAVLWNNGIPVALTGPGYFGTEATAINNEGVVVGALNDYPNTSGIYAFVWQNGTLTELPILSFQTAPAYPIYTSSALAINDKGQIVGWAANNTTAHATLWQNGAVIDLGLWTATAINNEGVIVGYGPGYGIQLAYEWQNGTTTTLPNLPGYNYGGASSINDAGIIAGYCTDNDKAPSTGYLTAVIWENGEVIDLNSLLPQNSPWHLEMAGSINNQNMIIGEGLYNGVQAEFEMTLGSGAIGMTAQAAVQSGQLSGQLTIIDSAADVSAVLDQLQTLAKAGRISSIDLTDSAPATLSISVAQLSNDTDALATVSGTYNVQIADSAANVSSNFGSLENAAYHKEIEAITLTDPGLATLTLTPSDYFGSGYAFAILSGNFVLETASPQSGMSVVNPTDHGFIVTFTGNASNYVIAADSDGKAVDVTPIGSTTGADYLAGVTALQFSDLTEIIASTPGSASAPTSGNITELYSAALAREPDVAGLAFYQNYLKANPNTPLQTFAEYFLSSSEYVSTHNYAQNAAGDTQFIKDSYQNLLHRTPDASEVSFYENNVLAPAVAGLAAGTTAYANAQFQAHALMLVYFSASPEFLSDVQITAQNPPSAQHWLQLI